MTTLGKRLKIPHRINFITKEIKPDRVHIRRSKDIHNAATNSKFTIFTHRLSTQKPVLGQKIGNLILSYFHTRRKGQA